jgi:hypothetical protein
MKKINVTGEQAADTLVSYASIMSVSRELVDKQISWKDYAEKVLKELINLSEANDRKRLRKREE